MADIAGNDDWNHRGGSFRRLLEHLVGETVRIQTDDSAFSGKLADVETTFVTLASSNHHSHGHEHENHDDHEDDHGHEDKKKHKKHHGSSTNVTLVYIPVRKINAVTNL